MEGRCPQRPNLRNTKYFGYMVSIVRSPGTATLQQRFSQKYKIMLNQKLNNIPQTPRAFAGSETFKGEDRRMPVGLNQKSVSVAIVTANRCEMLDACLGSLLKSDYPIHELFVFDNNSSDNTVETVRSKYPQVTLIQNERNIGLSLCHNRAMKEFSGDCILLIDDDNEVAPDMIRKLVDHLYSKQEEKTGAVMPVIYNFYEPETIIVAGSETDLWTGRTISHPKIIEEGKTFYESKQAPNSFIIRREMIERFGVLDEQIFSTLGDEDLVRRMNKGGWHCHVVLAAATYHKINPSVDIIRRFGMTNPARVYVLARNKTVLIRRYAKWYQLLTYLIFWHNLFAAFYLYLLIFKSRNWTFIKAYLKGLRDAFIYVFTKKLPPLSYVLKMLEN